MHKTKRKEGYGFILWLAITIISLITLSQLYTFYKYFPITKTDIDLNLIFNICYVIIGVPTIIGFFTRNKKTIPLLIIYSFYTQLHTGWIFIIHQDGSFYEILRPILFSFGFIIYLITSEKSQRVFK